MVDGFEWNLLQKDVINGVMEGMEKIATGLVCLLRNVRSEKCL